MSAQFQRLWLYFKPVCKSLFFLGLIFFLGFIGLFFSRAIQSQNGEQSEASSSEEFEENVVFPSFENAPITELLGWIHQTFGIGFVYDDQVLLNEAGELLRVHHLASPELTRENDCTLALFESLKPFGLVLIPVEGMAGPTYQLRRLEDALGYGPSVSEVDELRGYYFGTLVLEARTISLDELFQLCERYSSESAEVIRLEPASKVLVADYIDNLYSLEQAVGHAQKAAQRDDDIVSEIFKPARHNVYELAWVLDASRQAEEKYQSQVHRASEAILVTGRRKDIAQALKRLEKLDQEELAEGFELKFRHYSVSKEHLEAVHNALRDFFEAELSARLLRITILPIKESILIHSSLEHYKLGEEFLEIFMRTLMQEG